MSTLEHIDLGRAGYDNALTRQRRCVERTRADGRTRVVLVEHDPPVITLGRRGGDVDLLATPERLAAEGIGLRQAARGGQATWHGPGQLVAYVVRRLGRRGRTVHGHVHLLEEAVIAALRRFGIDAFRREGAVGVWVGDRKIAAVGVAVERWIAYHGLAVNVDCDVSAFEMIVPCGDRGARPTSMADVLARPVAVEQVKPVLLKCLDELLAADAPQRKRLPGWLRKGVPAGGRRVRELLAELGLATVCTSARCPNRAECFGRHTATFMILGTRCTRACRFCAVESAPPSRCERTNPRPSPRPPTGSPCGTSSSRPSPATTCPTAGPGTSLGRSEPSEAAFLESTVEVLVPDFQGDGGTADTVLDARPDVFNHNVETVPRLYPAVRPQADYGRSLDVLARAAGREGVVTKSGLMAGLGEMHEEVLDVMRDLRAAGCEILTIGQYLPPTDAHLPVARFVPPEVFAAWRREARELGFTAVAAGPFVRSSYRADRLLHPEAGLSPTTPL